MSDVMSASPGIPARIGPDRWTQPWWDAAAEHRLVACQCANCKTFRSPPSPYCPQCLSQEVNWVTLSGEAVLYTFTIIRHAPSPELAGSVPFVVGVVKLPDADDAKLVTNVVNCRPEDVRIGMELQVVWDDLDEGVTVPRFEPRHEQ
jgi:uncharacterized OB-fold protein